MCLVCSVFSMTYWKTSRLNASRRRRVRQSVRQWKCSVTSNPNRCIRSPAASTVTRLHWLATTFRLCWGEIAFLFFFFSRWLVQHQIQLKDRRVGYAIARLPLTRLSLASSSDVETRSISIPRARTRRRRSTRVNINKCPANRTLTSVIRRYPSDIEAIGNNSDTHTSPGCSECHLLNASDNGTPLKVQWFKILIFKVTARSLHLSGWTHDEQQLNHWFTT